MSKKRWTFVTLLLALSVGCGVSIFRLNAANPTSGMISPAAPPLSWTGAAAGGTSNWEDTCVEG
jgi:hypothetical protein